MIFESELETVLKSEMERVRDIMVSGNITDMRIYERYVGGYQAMERIIEDLIPDIRKKINES